jgi:SnoaL-like polyketide cyclase
MGVYHVKRTGKQSRCWPLVKEFWGNPWNPNVVDEMAAPDILLQYSLHAPRRGREDVKKFMIGFREAFPDLDFWGAADLIAEGDYVNSSAF